MGSKPKSRKGKKFTKKEENIIRENYGILKAKDLAELLGRDVKSIRDKASLLKATNKPWSDEELAFLIQNYQTKEYKELGKKIGRSPKAVLQKVYILGLESKRKEWSEAEVEWLKEQYKKSPNERNINLNEIARKLSRNKTNICRMFSNVSVFYVKIV